MVSLLPGLIKKSGVVSWAPCTWTCVHSFGHKPRENYSKKQCYPIHHQLQPCFFRIQFPTQKIPYPKIQSPLRTLLGLGWPKQVPDNDRYVLPHLQESFPFQWSWRERSKYDHFTPFKKAKQTKRQLKPGLCSRSTGEAGDNYFNNHDVTAVRLDKAHDNT